MNKMQRFIRSLINNGINDVTNYSLLSADKEGILTIINNITGKKYKIHVEAKILMQEITSQTPEQAEEIQEEMDKELEIVTGEIIPTKPKRKFNPKSLDNLRQNKGKAKTEPVKVEEPVKPIENPVSDEDEKLKLEMEQLKKQQESELKKALNQKKK